MPTKEDAKLQGFVEDEKIEVSTAWLEAMRRSLARVMLTCEQISYECGEMLTRCVHSPECPGKSDETVPCEPHCPDREWRLSALVIRRNCQQHVEKVGKVTLPRTADGILLPPPREFIEHIVAQNELLSAKLEERERVSTEPAPPFDSLPPVLSPLALEEP
jgi:hypothetical protein